MSIIPEAVLEEAARRFALLGDETRLRLVASIHERGEIGLQELSALTGTSISNASQHLSRLQVGGIVHRRREGRTVRYSIADPTIEALCDIVCAGVRERARRLSA
jgi:DNA-binding transcriptional ArsR family regulator